MYPVWTPRIRALCNGRGEFYSPPQSFHEPKRTISIIYTSIPTELTAWNSAVDCLPIKAQVLPSDSTPGSMSEGVSGESRADELVWVAGCAALLG